MTKNLLQVFGAKWKSYRHRFVPWVCLNLQKNERTLRQVNDHSDKQIRDDEVLSSLARLFSALLRSDWRGQSENRLRPTSSQHTHLTTQNAAPAGPELAPCDTALQTLGFYIDKRSSSLPSAGTGVFVTQGHVPKGVVVAMYPGTIYQADDPILIQSIRNPFVFRCIDGVLIDGNDKGISKLVFRSCSGRDRLGPFRLSDSSWLTPHLSNPLAVGQYVNNCSNDKAANVCYQEFDVPDGFPLELHQYFPNVNYRPDVQRPLRCVVLVSLRAIHRGEELFSNYYTIVH
ncbi:SET domain-containing protein 9 [Electrophorus electricus]|uniref:SET domain-containing protein n=1 Tax=Electrophorus electricus TaxID=8005 RepID=A0A4W4H8R1_ELEEL|nr:SET domain-containing protein 9 [Electrophorus electricus]